MKTIVYDWNGTLLDDARIALDSFNFIMVHYGHPKVTMEQYRAHYDMPLSRLYLGLGLTNEAFDAMQSTLGDVFHNYYESHATQAPMRQGAATFLHKAHQAGLRQLILSNHLVDPIRTQTDRFDVTSCFEKIIADPSREEQFKLGPKGEKLRRYMNDNAIASSDTFIIGDSPEEMLIAHDLGLTSVAVTGGYVNEERLRATHPDYVVHSLDELAAILAQKGVIL